MRKEINTKKILACTGALILLAILLVYVSILTYLLIKIDGGLSIFLLFSFLIFLELIAIGLMIKASLSLKDDAFNVTGMYSLKKSNSIIMRVKLLVMLSGELLVILAEIMRRGIQLEEDIEGTI